MPSVLTAMPKGASNWPPVYTAFTIDPAVQRSCVNTPGLPIASMPVKNTADPSSFGAASKASVKPPLAPGAIVPWNVPELHPPPVPPELLVLPLVLVAMCDPVDVDEDIELSLP